MYVRMYCFRGRKLVLSIISALVTMNDPCAPTRRPGADRGVLAVFCTFPGNFSSQIAAEAVLVGAKFT